MSKKKGVRYHYIYKTTNLKNGNYYIGMHSTYNLEDGYMGSGVKIKKSIERFGKDNHETIILEYCPSRVKLKNREKEIVNETILKDKNCLNMKEGGDGGFVDKKHKMKFLKAGKVERKKKREAKNRKKSKITIWITNGKVTKKILKTSKIPVGWRRGRK